MNNIILKTMMVLILTVVLASFGTNVFAATTKTTPTLVNKLNNILKKIKEYMVKLAGPAAALSIVTGVMIRKLSFGDEEKMIIGKKVIVNAVLGYLVILLVDLIIKFIEALV